MKTEEFHMLKYFQEYYLVDFSFEELEERIELFFLHENKECVEAFRNDIEMLYMYALNGTMPIIDVAGLFIGRGRISDERAESIIQIICKNTEKRKFRMIWYFFHFYLSCHIDWFDLKNCIEDFLRWENIEALKMEIDTLYIGNDPDLMRETAHIESKIEKFFVRENKERIAALKKETEAMYTLINSPELMKVVAHRFGGDIRVPVWKAVTVIKLLYDKSVKMVR